MLVTSEIFYSIIRSTLDSSASIMKSSGVGSSPYKIISGLSESYFGIGCDIYNIILSFYGSSEVACSSACAHCCCLNSTVQTRSKSNAVGMTLFDGVVLLEYLVSIRHTDAARKVLENADTVWRALPQTLDRLLCPFDVDGKCAVYSARPMVCRLYFSSDVSHCITQASVPANERQVDTQIARILRPIRRELNSNAQGVLRTLLPNATFGYFDFMTTAHMIVNAVMNGQEDAMRSAINTNQTFTNDHA